jgi:hypothetical protein
MFQKAQSDCVLLLLFLIATLRNAHRVILQVRVKFSIPRMLGEERGNASSAQTSANIDRAAQNSAMDGTARVLWSLLGSYRE